MRTTFAVLGFSFSLISALAGTADAQSWTPPTEEERCPTKWGAGYERGAANHMGPETVLRAARLIRTGEVIELAYVLSGSTRGMFALVPAEEPSTIAVKCRR